MHELDNADEFSSIDFNSHREVSPHKPDWWVDDGQRGTWQDGYTARKRVFPDGQCEVTVSRERFFKGAAITPKSKAKRGESDKREANDDDAGRRAKKQVRLCCKAIGADRMVTLTYRENMVDRETALKHWDLFRRKLGKHKQFHYVAVIEQQARGALHFHVACAGRQMYALLRSIWQGILGRGADGEQMGQVNVRNPHKFGFGVKGAHKIASYIAKYCGKSYSDGFVDPDFVGPIKPVRVLDQKRYFRSRGVVVPEVQFWRLPCTDQLGAVNAAFAALYGHSLNGLQSWCNNGLGVVYLATEPGCVDVSSDCPF